MRRPLLLAGLLLVPACTQPTRPAGSPTVVRWTYAVHRDPQSTPEGPEEAQEMSRSAHALEMRAALIGVEGARVIAGVDEITVDLPALSDENAARLETLFARRGVLEFVPVVDDPEKLKVLADALEKSPIEGVSTETDPWFAPGTHKEHKIPHLEAGSRETLAHALEALDAQSVVAPLTVAIGEAAPSNGSGGPRWRTWILDRKAGLLDPGVVSAAAQTSRTASQPQVSVEFSPATTKRFADLTRKHLGQKLAILVDGEVESAPIVQDPITNGRAIVSMGRDTPKDATDLAIILDSGRIPYAIERVSVANRAAPRK